MKLLKIIVLIFTASITGCVGHLHFNFKSTGLLNPDIEQQSLPVQVKIYQLRDKQKFLHASFQDLWLRDRSTLATTLVAKRVLMINPSSTSDVKIRRKKAAKYLGLVAVFREPWMSRWRVLMPVPHGVKSWQRIKVQLHANTIRFGK